MRDPNLIRRSFLVPLLLVAVTLAIGGEEAPDFKLPNLRNKQVALSGLLKKGPVLLDFWATWCKPCLKSFPVLESWHRKYGEKGLVVVGINEDGPRNSAKIKPFVRSLKVTFEILVDANNDVMRRFRVQNLPTTILIASDGTILARSVGYTAEEMEKLEAKVVDALKSRRTKKP